MNPKENKQHLPDCDENHTMASLGLSLLAGRQQFSQTPTIFEQCVEGDNGHQNKPDTSGGTEFVVLLGGM